MPRTVWYNEIAKVKPHVFKISTPSMVGTGFLIFRNRNGLCGIATAYHVIASAFEWEQPVRITHALTGATKVLHPIATERVIFPHQTEDLAFILFEIGDMNLGEEAPALIDPNVVLNQGVEIGWLGFPAVASDHLCFFTGHLSAYLQGEKGYLVDGVAIHGVSGGPAFFTLEGNEELRICGVVTNYFPNKASGEALPGLAMIRSVEPYQEDLRNLRTLDEAQEKAVEEAKAATVDAEDSTVSLTLPDEEGFVEMKVDDESESDD